ncbi:hypothetical protein Tco_0403823, partial [Tanacetum coccineum]
VVVVVRRWLWKWGWQRRGDSGAWCGGGDGGCGGDDVGEMVVRMMM